MVWCKGGHIFADGGKEYRRYGGQLHNVIDTSILDEKEEPKKKYRKLTVLELAEKYKDYLDARG